MAVPIYIPTKTVEGFPLLSPKFVIFVLLMIAILRGVVMQKRVVQPPYVGVFNSFSPVIEI